MSHAAQHQNAVDTQETVTHIQGMKNTAINVRCTEDEKAAYHALAASRGASISNFVRSFLREQISAAQPPVTASVGASNTSLDAKG